MNDVELGPILSKYFGENRKRKNSKAPSSKKDRVIRKILKRSGKKDLPTLASLLHGKGGSRVAIKDIGLFTFVPEDEVLAELAGICTVQNRVNLSAEVQLKRVVEVGAEIVRSGRMYQPIQVARLPDGTLECTSGRHRLAFLALAYGADKDIPVYTEDMTLCEARDAVVVANQARPTKALERAEHSVLQAVGGDADAEQDELYMKTVTQKAKARRYCVYSVISRGYPEKLAFTVSQTSSRRDGGLTTITNVENFWALALDWYEGMPRKEFDEALKKSVLFINTLAESIQTLPGFDASQHLSSMALCAVGKYYRARNDLTGSDWTTEEIVSLAKALVFLGEIGRTKSEKIYAALAKIMRED